MIDENIVREMIDRQKKMIEELSEDNFFSRNSKKAIDFVDRGYILLKEKTILYYNKFWKCPGCDQVYWFGSHWKQINKTLNQINLKNDDTSEK